MLCGCKGYRALGDWSQSLSRQELVRFGSSREKGPSEPTIRRLIQRIDADEFDKDIGQWVLEQKLIDNPDGDVLKNCGIAIDGKTVRGSHNGAKKAIHLL